MNIYSRRGFTLVELLIVIAIIGTLMALLLPAIQGAREEARRSECSNNLRQLGLGVQSYVSSPKGLYPGWMQLENVSPNIEDTYRNGAIDGSLLVSWAAKLLPYVDQAALWDQLRTNNNGNGFDGQRGQAAAYDAPPFLGVFTCPSDAKSSSEIGYLSYIANSGIPDVFISSSFNEQKLNGLFHNLAYDSSLTMRTTDVKDGAQTTLMLSENIHKDDALTSGINNNWLCSSNWDISDPMKVGQTEQAFGMTWVFVSGNANNPSAGQRNSQEFQPFNTDARENPSGTYMAYGVAFRRPASNHTNVFNVAFAGGNMRSINQQIEYRVYQQLMTPNGAKAVYSMGTDYTEIDDMGFMSQPLSDADY